MTMRPIYITELDPAIPERWMAYYEGCREHSARGFGPTREAAIKDLTDNFPDDGPAELPQASDFLSFAAISFVLLALMFIIPG